MSQFRNILPMDVLQKRIKMILYYFIGFILADLLVSTNGLGIQTVNFAGYDKWSPPGQPMNQMFCPTSCARDDRCCLCKAKRCWEINMQVCGIVIGQLHLEYTDIFGSAMIVTNTSVNATFYEFAHPNGRLSAIPTNICAWANTLIKVDLKNNSLTNITILKCLINLDILELDNNLITHVHNTTFSNMENLRILSLSNNMIEYLEPNAITIKHGNIPSVDMSFNNFEIIDMSNLYRYGSFCSLSYEGNTIQHHTNEANLTITEGLVFGPGDINLNNTQLGSFTNYTQLGITDSTQIGKYIRGSIWMDASSVSCDCNLYPLFQGLGRNIFHLWGNLIDQNFTCESPERMKGFNLTNIFEQDLYDTLICDIQVNCPYLCHCIDMPSQSKVIVNCSWAGLSEMPKYMPTGSWDNYKIELLVNNNNIERVKNIEYLNRLILLDLTGNPISNIESHVPVSINENVYIEIENQALSSLSKEFQTKDPRYIKFGQHPIICNCDNIWIGDWMRLYQARNILFCSVEGRILASDIVSADYFDCVSEDAQLSLWWVLVISLIVFSLFALVAFATYAFRYELLLLKRKYLNKNTNCLDYEYDVFLSFCEENADVFSWINKFVLPVLKTFGYSVFCPWFHLGYGSNRDESVAKAIGRSRHYVVCLCDTYLLDMNSVSEFDSIWKQFLIDETKKITIINFTPVRTKSIHDGRMKAFRRIRDDLNFKCTESKLTERLKRRIGPPKRKPEIEPQQTNAPRNHVANTSPGIKVGQNSIGRKEFQPTVFERLSTRKSTCNCKYRRCYMHAKHTGKNDFLYQKEIGSRLKSPSQHVQMCPIDSVC